MQYEFSFEQHNNESNKIYRLLVGKSKFVPEPIMFFKPLTENVPELHDATIVYKELQCFFMVENKRQILNEAIFTDKNFLSLFKIEVIEGGKNNLLNAPNTALLSESEAKKLFPNGDAVGKLIKYHNRYDVEIKGVFKDTPITTCYRPNIILNIEAIKTLNPYQYTVSGYSSSVFYFRIAGNPDFDAINSKMNKQGKITYNDTAFEAKYQFQPLSDIHLYSADTKWDIIKRSDIKTVRVFKILIQEYKRYLEQINHRFLTITL